MSGALVIVESPAKAKTIAGFLGDGFIVESSIGHIRDLAVKANLPDSYRQEPWAGYGVDVYNGFKPVYVVDPGKRAKVRELKALLRTVDELYLATDEDREGEAIAWHLLEELNPPERMPVHRMVFHEITREAIRTALSQPRQINRRLVDAQETRRILDRLYGWDMSMVVKRVVSSEGSAGRVQTVAVRIVVERERERMAFVRAGYWSVGADLARVEGDTRSFSAATVVLDGRRVATGRDFDQHGAVDPSLVVLDEPTASTLAGELAEAAVVVRSVERKPYRRRPAAPFTTSTFQQEAGRKLRFSAQRAMRAAQALYERGFITYMRTDSTTLSATALDAARREITERFGSQYLPDGPRTYTTKAKNAQEAHEAIRPAGEAFRHPDDVARSGEVTADMAAAYRIIWQRTVASQMTDATGETVSVRFRAPLVSWREAELAASGTVITHPGFRLAYIEDVDEGDEGSDEERQLPALAEGDGVRVLGVRPEGHATQPPARYTEASLVKRLEELGIGRPSTYAATIEKILDKGYVWKKGSALVPSLRAFAIVNLMEQHFPDLVDYQFTALMEEDLDEIARGESAMVPWLSRFYWGDDGPAPTPGGIGTGLHAKVQELPGLDVRAINSIPLGVDADGVPVEARSGKFGPFVSRGEDSASIPDDLPLDELTIERALELLSVPKEGRLVGVDPETGKNVYAKAGRFGPYVQLGELPEDRKRGEKPRTASLFATMTVERVTLDEALELLSLPRTLGVDPDDGGEVTASNGKFGPYVQKTLPDGAKDSRSLENEEQLLTVTLEQAKALFAQPKRRRGQAAAKPPLRELGVDPVSERPIVLKDGRFGPYVTDGDTNASLRTGDDPESVTHERAVELLADRRAKLAEGGGGRRPTKAAAKKSAKTSAAKKAATKAAAKKSAKKSAAKKAATKRSAAGESTTVSPDDGERAGG
jgi:DNA topoisomerase-1